MCESSDIRREPAKLVMNTSHHLGFPLIASSDNNGAATWVKLRAVTLRIVKQLAANI